MKNRMMVFQFNSHGLFNFGLPLLIFFVFLYVLLVILKNKLIQYINMLYIVSNIRLFEFLTVKTAPIICYILYAVYCVSAFFA